MALDTAMLRGGRFDTQSYVGVPDQAAREFLVNRALGGIAKEEDVDLPKLAWALEGYGGRDVTAICEKIKLEPYQRAVLTGEVQSRKRRHLPRPTPWTHRKSTAATETAWSS